MRKRYQHGRVQKRDRYWIGKWREGTTDRSTVLGKVSQMTKSEAQTKLADIVAPVNADSGSDMTMRQFIVAVYLPFFKKKWKRSTYMTNKDRVMRDIAGEFGGRKVRELARIDLQAFLDSKQELSFSIVAHLRWDLRQIFNLAKADGLVKSNPADVLYVPKNAAKPRRDWMTIEQVKLAFEVLPLRERVIVKLAVIAGMRPGEIFGLRHGRIAEDHADIQERVYRGDIDTPKTAKSVRLAALSVGLITDLKAWAKECPSEGPESWLFPSEKLSKPMNRDNVMRRYIRPALKRVKLDWVDFQTMRRTHSSLMEELGVDPKIVADQQGHDLGVHMNVYTETSLESRRNAVDALESAFIN